MKTVFRTLMSCLFAVVLAGCSGGDPDEMRRSHGGNANTKRPVSAQAYYDKSVELARMNGCWACHHIKQGMIGPSWQAVSERYKDAPGARAMLIEKVKHGSSGAWTRTTSGAIMPPNSPRVSDEHIAELVDFILSLARGGKPQQ